MLGGVIQHESRSHMASDLARYLYVSSYTEHETALNQASPPLEFWPKSLLPKHANVRETRGRRIVEGFSTDLEFRFGIGHLRQLPRIFTRMATISSIRIQGNAGA